MQNTALLNDQESREIIEGLVESGEYPNEQEAVKAALKLLAGDSNAKLARLRRLIDEGLNSGPPVKVTREGLLAEIKAKL
ncbi:type II toxin-antitoxin system ParD family antitoxin [Marinibactrum halimedae]|uniref:Type II toxin-antitoxin system ParD family antitoxin n=1 Tax=Marinibactrum halimedae TaxID=1444977 RepID=A0AA37WQ63_9GAMM|nr:type II toxin-antitoxin system ParD family antitoxin [Marinibactrum halimedae]MCD9458877.1 type II toxin-antitoxin system ParD family antitoxin [Marinibactrum halimedae]GLS27726.1 hypothetical protein GCM10007877_34450 [Marinibactrum halimedae]